MQSENGRSHVNGSEIRGPESMSKNWDPKTGAGNVGVYIMLGRRSLVYALSSMVQFWVVESTSYWSGIAATGIIVYSTGKRIVLVYNTVRSQLWGPWKLGGILSIV
jgi:hypothetical protein